MSKAQQKAAEAKAEQAAVEAEDDNPEGYPRFVSLTGKAVMLATTRGGHTVAIGTKEQTGGKGTPLHPRFHRTAVMKGCMPVGMEGSIDAEETSRPQLDREQLILKAIADIVAQAHDDPSKAEELFTTDGRPDVNALKVKLGFPISAAERDTAWTKYNDDEVDSSDPD